MRKKDFILILSLYYVDNCYKYKVNLKVNILIILSISYNHDLAGTL